ncbi:MAG TPA: rhomboid family intramembrane serine protease [Flavisolibacter sp.]|nr:rhomboid family intramembrane serine protease [Flavisolibacter sp.]
MDAGSISIIIILINLAVSWKGLTNDAFYERHIFGVDRILINKEYGRLITSGFLHVNWMHLIFNLIALYAFSAGIEYYLGSASYLLIYFASLIGGNLFSLFIHRHDGSFRSAGASGAISGIIFASIALFPGFHIGFFFLPLSIPGWLFGVVYVLYSIYGIRSKTDNVGHEAHLAGAVVGMLIGIAIEPAAIRTNYVAITAILVPAIIFIYFIITRPYLLLVDNSFFKSQQRYYSIDHRYNAEKRDRQQEIDRLLEKIHKQGMKSLTKKEREFLSEYSKVVN